MFVKHIFCQTISNPYPQTKLDLKLLLVVFKNTNNLKKNTLMLQNEYDKQKMYKMTKLITVFQIIVYEF